MPLGGEKLSRSGTKQEYIDVVVQGVKKCWSRVAGVGVALEACGCESIEVWSAGVAL